MITKNFGTILTAAITALSLVLVTVACSCPQQAPPEPSQPPAVSKPADTLEAPGPIEPLEVTAQEGDAEPKPDATAPPFPEKRPYADSPHAETIDAGLVFMAENRTNHKLTSWMDYFVLDYLQRKFELDSWFSWLEAFDPEVLAPDILAEASLHARLVMPEHSLEQAEIPFAHVSLFGDYGPPPGKQFITAADLRRIESDMSRVMLRAMYCDEEPVGETLAREIFRTAINANYYDNEFEGYIATHMILAWQWLRELGCADELETFEDVEERFTDILVGIVQHNRVVTDLAMEAMAFLFYIGADDRVKNEWIEAVAAAQMPEGAWDRHAGADARPNPQGHTTVFALWVLLEDALPEAKAIPWLR